MCKQHCSVSPFLPPYMSSKMAHLPDIFDVLATASKLLQLIGNDLQGKKEASLVTIDHANVVA